MVIYFIAVCTILLLGCQENPQSLQLTGLATESHINPSGIDNPNPRFSWKIESKGFDQGQTAYQVLVASSEAKLNETEADIWNSGKVESSQSLFVPIAGAGLESSKEYYWKVRVWDKDGKASRWSEAARFITGILDPAQWKAQWAGAWFPNEYAPQWQYGQWIGTGQENRGEAFFRKSFHIENTDLIEKAILRVHSGNRSYIHLNSRLIKECAHWVGMYEIDVDFRLKAGKNVLAIHARDREGNRPDIMASLMLQMKDGTVEFIFTDNTWKARPISAPAEWAQAFFFDRDWANAVDGDPTRRSLRTPEYGPKAINLRKEIDLSGNPETALVHITGLGSYQLFINGNKVSDDLLTPGWTEFDQRVEYQTYDVKPYLNSGTNTIGIMLGNSWWQFHYNNFKRAGIDTLLKAFLQLEVGYSNGTTQTFITDNTWKAAPSAIMKDHIWHGEVVDFRKKEKGWMINGFDDSHWKNTTTVEYPAPLVAQKAEPMIITEELAPKSITPTLYGTWIVDFGQNVAGWVALKAPEIPSKKILVQYAEVQNPDGSLFLGNLRSAKSINKYYLTGNESGMLQPRFTYHGFRYVEVFGYPETLHPDDIVAKVIHADVKQAGDFACSDELLNKIFLNEQWTFRGNFYAVPTDCPQRDERLGWLADAGNIPVTAAYFYNVNRYFDKWVYDMKDSQKMGGYFPNFSPSMGGSAFGSSKGAPGWADAGVKVPYTLYQFYGDTLLLKNHYEAMKQHVESMRRESVDNLYEVGGWGDWLAVEPSPAQPIGSAYYFYSTDVLARTAAILGYNEDALFMIPLQPKLLMPLTKNILTLKPAIMPPAHRP
jgi:alpha-L-rhamnosidase